MGVPPPAYQTHPDQSAFPQQTQQAGNPYIEQAPAVNHPQSFHATSPPPDQKGAHPAPMAQQGYQSHPQGPHHPQVQQHGPHPIPLASLLKEPNWVQCPSCAHVQMTRVEFVSGRTTHLWAAAFCCCLCLGCIPYCVSSMKNVEHHCGHCGTLLATYNRGSGTEVNAAAAHGPPVKA